MWPYPFMPYPWPSNPTTPPPTEGGFKIKDIRRAVKFYQDILNEEEKKKKEKDKNKKPESKSPSFNVLQTFALITIMGPFVGLTYLYFLEQLIKALTH